MLEGFFEENVYLLIGGFHLMGKSPKELRKIAKKLDELKVERIAPCHCSGDTARGFSGNITEIIILPVQQD